MKRGRNSNVELALAAAVIDAARQEHEPKIDGRTGQVTHCRCGKMLPCKASMPQTSPTLIDRMMGITGELTPVETADLETYYAHVDRTRFVPLEMIEFDPNATPVAKSENLYGLMPAPFNEDVERVKFRDWYRNDHGSSAEHVPGVWASRTTMIAWNAWLARAKQ